MTSIGKRILSAFVEVEGTATAPPAVQENTAPAPVAASTAAAATDSNKFRQHFEKLSQEGNKPGPDYYEFAKMIEAMNSLPDEKARYAAAYAGLQVQGLDKQKLLSTAADYLQLLDSDATEFHATIDAAMQEKVQGKQKEMELKKARIQQLSEEITHLQNSIAALENEVKENEKKIYSSTGGYQAEMARLKNRITTDMEKINQFIN